MPAVTALIPCYNHGDFLAEAVASIRRQTRVPDEILVVDDGSTDESAEVARALDVRLVSTPRNLGGAGARNLGISEARGDLIAMLDADDRWKPHHLETLLALHEEFPDSGVYFSAVELIGDPTRRLWPVDTPLERPVDHFWESFRDTCVPHSAVLVERSLMEEIEGYSEDLRAAVDFDAFLRLACVRPFVRTDRVTAEYRRHENQVTARSRLEQVRCVYRSRARLLRRVTEAGETRLAESMASRMATYWQEDLSEAWGWNDHAQVRTLIGLVPQVPSLPVHRRLAWQARVWARESMLRVWWKVRPLVRRASGPDPPTP